MTAVKVPLSSATYRNVDGSELEDKNIELNDGYVDEVGALVRRPGLEEIIDLELGPNNSVDGLYWWSNKSCAYAVSSGRIFKIEYANGVMTKTDMTGVAVTAGAKPSFATDGSRLFIAAGGAIVYTDNSAATAAIADLDAPTEVTHLCYLDQMIIANKVGTDEFYYSNVGDALTWEAADVFRAVGSPDKTVAHDVLNRELYLFGETSTEIWEHNGEDPFARVPGGVIEAGCIAKYSLVRTSDSITWLDDNKKFVQWSNGSLTRLSTPYDKEISEFETVSDCTAEKLEIAGKLFLIFHFPSEERTLVFNTTMKDWNEWTYWDSDGMDYGRWLVSTTIFCPAWGLWLGGSRLDSKLYSINPRYYDDDGDEIRMRRLTGHISYGTSGRKRSSGMRIRVKRGFTEYVNPKLMLRWNDDNKRWSNIREIPLGNVGDTELVIYVNSAGIFRTRQYEISATDPVPIIVSMAEENIEALE